MRSGVIARRARGLSRARKSEMKFDSSFDFFKKKKINLDFFQSPVLSPSNASSAGSRKRLPVSCIELAMPRRRGGGRGGGADWYSKSRGRGGDAGGKGGRRGKKGGVVDDTKKQHRWQPAEAGPPGPVVLQQQPERSLLPPAASSSEDEGGGDDEEESAAAVPAPLTTRGDEGPPPSAPAGTGGADSGVEGTQLATDRAIHTGGSDPSPPRSIADLNAADTVRTCCWRKQ